MQRKKVSVNRWHALHVMGPELHTVLAALRFYQQHAQYAAANRSPWIDGIATNLGQVTALDDRRINTLCQRLNVMTF